MALMPGLQRLLHRAAIHDARRDPLDLREAARRDGPLAVERLAERVDDAPEQLLADRHRDDASRPLDLVAFADGRRFAEQHRADAVFFEVQRDAEHAVRELEHLAGHRALDAVDAGDAVADRDHGADFRDIHVDRQAPDLVADDLRNVVSLDVHRVSFACSGSSEDERE